MYGEKSEQSFGISAQHDQLRLLSVDSILESDYVRLRSLDTFS